MHQWWQGRLEFELAQPLDRCEKMRQLTWNMEVVQPPTGTILRHFCVVLRLRPISESDTLKSQVEMSVKLSAGGQEHIPGPW